MAQSYAHKFGQLIGDLLEDAIRTQLRRFAKSHDLYLDMRGKRTCRRGTKCSWKDSNGNTHDLDFVLERGGSDDNFGMPIAFVETAWRRYTKHSRNKAQEIQGAILPLAETYRHLGPFKGAVLAGVFTDGALSQLRSLGFTILYIPYESVVKAFAKCGVTAEFDEQTSETEFRRRIDAFTKLTAREHARLAAALLSRHRKDVADFMVALSNAVLRQIERIVVLVLHGTAREVSTVEDAVAFVLNYETNQASMPVHQYEIQVRYNNGNVIDAKFQDKGSAVEFLRSFQPVQPKSL